MVTVIWVFWNLCAVVYYRIIPFMYMLKALCVGLGAS